ncbi:MAG: cytochrome c biogenesis protein CcsA [Chloroflexi bacterium]|nr:cytochrome c biogenesis protein CcsA [Chloroflexota bacterium]MCH8115028.1 cytochrome c biogenesis protein CcsA [Chloroflexota bacterium]MCI0775182.1 cytochrome c biogenesis protein CcsA [Chloroflexota bacterium]MCI0803811.1 cytochrome c biogenesis protein CcsA [Chloroflexota bacterium]MCI0808772.1 cytochrome c biogenesis protein CcsA [Chloroflexota bacterium]
MTRVLSFLDPLPIFTAALMGVTLWLIFIWVPTEINQGAVQRILYFHVPVAWGSMLGIFIVSGSSIMYLWKKNEKWDRLAVASAEVGVVFGGLMLLSGMIWARPVWAVWWTGEAKLTTALILFFIYVAYLMFRAYFPPGAQRQRLAAVIGLIGAVNTPIIYFAANLWSQAHPPIIIGPATDAESTLGSDLGIVLMASTLAFTFLFIYLVQVRYKIRRAEDDIVELKRASGARTPVTPETPVITETRGAS